MGGNIGYIFYKDYYQNLVWRRIKEQKNKKEKDEADKYFSAFFSKKAESILNLSELEIIPSVAPHSFNLRTTYPGLIIGAGYNHQISEKGEFKLGFSFDFTTGMPIIPGPSIKGLLRSAFPIADKKYKARKSEYIISILKRSGNDGEYGEKDIINIELEIFEGKREINKNGRNIIQYLPLADRDIFHDAVPINLSGKLLNDDSLAPHENDLLLNPNPLYFLKIAPNVDFKFQFDLKDGILSHTQKLKLFMEIILDLGVGAKTNVGYGRLIDYQNNAITAIERDEKRCKIDNMSDEERLDFSINQIMEKISLGKEKPSQIFNLWQGNKNAAGDLNIAKAFLKIATLRTGKGKWSQQAKALSNILKVEKSDLEKMR